MNFRAVCAELLAFLYYSLPLYGALILLRGLLWFSPLKPLRLQRLLFFATEPWVARCRNSFGLAPRHWDPSLPLALAVLALVWLSLVRGLLNWALAGTGAA